MTDIRTTDEELESLMAELEAQNAELAGGAPVAKTTVEQPASKREQKETSETVQEVDEEAAALAALAELEKELETQEEKPKVASKPEPEPEPELKSAVKPEPVTEREPPFAVDTPAAPVVETKPVASPKAAQRSEPASSALKYYIDVDQFREDTRVTENTLDSAMIEQNSLRAYYGVNAAHAEAQASRLKARFEVVEAALYDHHRKELATSGEKVTEKMVETNVKNDSRWLKAKTQVIEAESIAAVNKALVESLKDRRDMIIQLGADRRDEYKGAARVMAEQNDRESLRERALAAAGRKAA